MSRDSFLSRSKDGEGQQSSADAIPVLEVDNNFEHCLGRSSDVARGNASSRAGTKTTGLDTSPSVDGTSANVHGSGTVSVGTEEIILKAEPNDILLGRGKPFQSHSGNQEMRRLVDGQKERYSKLPREKRGIVANELLQTLETRGARFLKRPKRNINDIDISSSIPAEAASGVSLSEDVNQGGWVLASKEEAYDKMCHALRAKGKMKRSTNENAEIWKDGKNLTESSSVSVLSPTQGSAKNKVTGGGDGDGDGDGDSNLERLSLSQSVMNMRVGGGGNSSPERTSLDGNELAIQLALEEYLGSIDKSS